MGPGRAVLLGLALVHLIGCHSGARPLARSWPRPRPEPETPSIQLNGRVEDPDHRPVRMARVILRERYHGWEQDAYTDEAGAFDFHIDYWTPYTLYVFDDRHPFGVEQLDQAGRFESGWLEPGEWVAVARHGTGSQRAHAIVPEGGETTVTLTLADRRFTVRGTVVDASDQRPLEGVEVSAFRLMDRRTDARDYAPMAGTTTDGAGRFALSGISDDLWYLLVRTSGHGSRMIHLEPSGADQDLGMVSLPAGDPDHDVQGGPFLIP